MYPLANYSDTEEPCYAAQIHHIAGHSADSCTPGTAILFLAGWQRQGEPYAWISNYLLVHQFLAKLA
jgi:hypothetical protein